MTSCQAKLIELQRQLADRLSLADVENAVQESRWIVDIVCGKQIPDEAALARIEDIMKQRLDGVPFQYTVGSVEFYSVELLVGPGVLIPRPETELLVEHAIAAMDGRPAASQALDLCTGSGAIPLAMAAERPQFEYIGIDISQEALKWAELNRQRLAPPHFKLLQGDLFAPLQKNSSQRFALITANPPYITPEEYETLPPEVKDYEPRLALEAPEDGLKIAFDIIRQAHEYMLQDATLLMEIGETQGRKILRCANECGYRNTEILRDLTGRDRFLKAVK